MGLLFVAISINVEKFQQSIRLDLRNFGALTFNSFFYVLLIAVIFLCPGLGWRGTGLALLVLGLVDLVNSILQKRRALAADSGDGRKISAGRFNVPIACLILLVLNSLLVLMQFGISLYLVLVLVICLLGTASVNAWSLLVRVDEQEIASAD
jgi:hypothetical protein